MTLTARVAGTHLAAPAASWVSLDDPDLIDDWDLRVRRHAGATPFAGPLFQTAVRRAFSPRGGRSGLAVRNGADLLGFLPLADIPIGRGALVLRESGFARNAHTLRNHLLMEPDPVVVAALVEAWRDRPGPDTLLLENLPAAGHIPELLVRVARASGLRADAPTPGRILDHADLRGGHDAYLATRTGQMRRQLRTKRRDLEAAGCLELDDLSGKKILAALPAWRAVAAASWQGAVPGAATTEADWAFHQEMAGCGRLWLARLDGQPVAALRMLEDAGAAYVHTMHFDARLKALAPGVVLFDAMMRDACARGLARVDFNGRTDFFARWATGATEHASVRIYRPGVRGRVAQAVRGWRRRRRSG